MESIEKELKMIKEIRYEFNSTDMDKASAGNLIYDIKRFEETVKEKFKNVEYHVFQTDANYNAKYDINKGLDNLTVYTKSNRKEADNKYFIKGKNLAVSGIDKLIKQL